MDRLVVVVVVVREMTPTNVRPRAMFGVRPGTANGHSK